jgi:Arc/MetJ family transcription regulator
LADRGAEGKGALKATLAMCILNADRTHRKRGMRTNIDIDDRLMTRAMKAAGKSTKKETVQEALELLIRIRDNQRKMRDLYGKVQWEGDLDAIRRAE